ncbi:MAG: TerC family protein [Deltaproteobacteria bacterium]|nr:TerC family protein [Deltaproteobacteria bacterium]
MMTIETIGTPGLWFGFTGFVLLMLALDLGVFRRKAQTVSTREALVWSIVWISLALSFAVAVGVWFGVERGEEFLAGFLIEKALAVDNLFVFAVIFSSFAVPPALQHRVLFWGILGALIMRGLFIWLGAALLQQFHWVMYVFGGFLVLTGLKLLFQQEKEMHPEQNPLVRLFKRLVPTVPDYHGTSFILRQNGRWYATPLLIVLLVIEGTDMVFAVDSIPAIFAVTNDPFIVYTSNIFAILGLRSLYFLLAGVLGMFHYLKVGLALVLAFVGVKMLLLEVYKIPIEISLLVIIALLGGAIVASLWWPRALSEDVKPAMAA